MRTGLRIVPALLFAAAAFAGVGTGTHWPAIQDYPALRNLGYDFAITTVNPANRREWTQTFSAAESAGLQLVVGMHPSPYQLRNGAWTISTDGEAFLRFAASEKARVKAIFVFNEPYWVNPFTNANDLCGVITAAQLRDLRAAIRNVWPEAMIYHDIGEPGSWAPGGSHWRTSPCVANKYADQSGIADYVGIWYYPFTGNGYQREEGLRTLQREIDFVRTKMGAEPVVANQAFVCRSCELPRWPTAEEMKDWHCATRSLSPAAISWYSWRQPAYDDYLANRPQLWEATSPGTCANDGAGIQPELLTAAAAPALGVRPIAPGSLVSVFGKGLSKGTGVAPPGVLPLSLAGASVTVNGVPAPLPFVSPEQINLQVPVDLSGDSAAVVVYVENIPSITVWLPLAPVSPAIFSILATGLGPGAILRGDGSLVSRANPLRPREYISIYAAGLGRVSPNVASGWPAPGAPGLAMVTGRVQVLIDGRSAPVLFAGLSPGYVGLYQVNAQAPETLSTPYPAVSLSVDGVRSQDVSAGGPGLLDASPGSVPAGLDAAITLRGANLSPASWIEMNGERLPARWTSGDWEKLELTIPKRLLLKPGRVVLEAVSTEDGVTIRSNPVELVVR